MARPTAEHETKTKSARMRLQPRIKPYYRGVGGNKSLGYVRRTSGPGSWVVREWAGGRYVRRLLGHADDVAIADGRDTLTFEQALRAATSAGLPPKANQRLTVAVAIKNYLAALAARSNHSGSTEQRLTKHVPAQLTAMRVDRLTKTDLERWRDGLVRDDDAENPGAKRASQANANRILSTLKAALNHAFSDESNHIPTDTAWRKVKPFKNVDVARQDHFDPKQVRALITKAATFDKSFANLLEAAFLTGARLGELGSLDVRHFDAARATLAIQAGKTGGRIITLGPEAVAFFKRLTHQRPAAAILLPRADAARWARSGQHRPFKRAAALAELPASASFYSLRHSYISRAIEGGMPLSLIAEQAGTSLLMIERNYQHVLASTRSDTVQRTTPRLRRVK